MEWFWGLERLHACVPEGLSTWEPPQLYLQFCEHFLGQGYHGSLQSYSQGCSGQQWDAAPGQARTQGEPGQPSPRCPLLLESERAWRKPAEGSGPH